MVVGPVGSGKSTLVSALNKFITCSSGDVKVSGTVSYCAQQAWILNATVKDNILFGQECDEARYKKTVQLAQLAADLDILPAGDQTIIGERGVTLSGGQKQRVAIARALYAESDVYVFDDPLSALDNHVGSAIFEKVITGELKNKTVILVTNALQYLPKANQVVVLGDGKMQEIGTYTSLMAKKGAFCNLMKTHGIDREDAPEKTSKKENDIAMKISPTIKSAGKDNDASKEEERAFGNVGRASTSSFSKLRARSGTFCLSSSSSGASTAPRRSSTIGSLGGRRTSSVGRATSIFSCTLEFSSSTASLSS